MKLAPVLCACGCGRVIVQPRGGGRRKRFFEGACRARFARRGRSATPEPVGAADGGEGQAKVVADLWQLYGQYKADLDERGAMIDGKLNPAGLRLQQVAVELMRLAPPAEAPPTASLLELVVGPPNVG